MTSQKNTSQRSKRKMMEVATIITTKTQPMNRKLVIHHTTTLEVVKKSPMHQRVPILMYNVACIWMIFVQTTRFVASILALSFGIGKWKRVEKSVAGKTVTTINAVFCHVVYFTWEYWSKVRVTSGKSIIVDLPIRSYYRLEMTQSGCQWLKDQPKDAMMTILEQLKDINATLYPCELFLISNNILCVSLKITLNSGTGFSTKSLTAPTRKTS